MAKHIKNIERVYDILVEVRKVFRDLNGDSIVALSQMSRLCKKIDDIIDNKEGTYENGRTTENKNKTFTEKK